MANGYVPHFMRPPPFAPPAQHRQYTEAVRAWNAAQKRQQQSSSPLNTDPAAIFGQAAAATEDLQCYFDSAFPASGPNIFQRFWIALFGPPIRLIIESFRALRRWCLLLQSGQMLKQLSTVGHNAHHTLLDLRDNVDAKMMLMFLSENRWSLLIGLIVVVALSVGAWFFSPKGDNQTVWRSTIVLSVASCYIMWAITFLAQWHPLIEPKMTKLRPDYIGGS